LILQAILFEKKLYFPLSLEYNLCIDLINEGVNMIRLIVGLILVLGGAGSVVDTTPTLHAFMFVLLGFTLMGWTIADGSIAKKLEEK